MSEPRCGICNRLENDSPNVFDYGPATEADWNGETGNHRFCEIDLLRTILGTMDVPEVRLDDHKWLLRNLPFRNMHHPRFSEAWNLLMGLDKDDRQKASLGMS